MARGTIAMNRMRWQVCIVVLLVALIAGIVMGSIATLAALDHNPQGEFWDYETGQIRFVPTLLLFFAWFLVTFMGIIAAASVLWVGTKFLGFFARYLNRLRTSR